MIFMLVLALGAGMATAQQFTAALAVKEEAAAFSWDEQTFDFGNIEKGKPVTHIFEFINNGTAPLLITNVKPSCGCTSPEWTKDPIPAGGTGFIKTTFNAANSGIFNKTIAVSANVAGQVVLTIKGVVQEVVN